VVLSRRDGKIVAWQFTGRNGAREDPPRRVQCNGTIAGSRLADALACPKEKLLSNIATSNRSYRSLRDGSFRTVSLAVNCQVAFADYGAPELGICATKCCDRDVGLAESGYYHLVPARQNLPRPVIKSTPHHAYPLRGRGRRRVRGRLCGLATSPRLHLGNPPRALPLDQGLQSFDTNK
jgi:hypothetical protein